MLRQQTFGKLLIEHCQKTDTSGPQQGGRMLNGRSKLFSENSLSLSVDRSGAREGWNITVADSTEPLYLSSCRHSSS